MRRIRVMQLIAPLSMAGAERVIQTQMRNLDGNRFETTVTAFLNHRRRTNDFCEAMERDGHAIDKIFLKYVVEWRPIRELIALARGRKTDVFHSHGHRSDVMGLIASKFLRIPIISTVHGWTFDGPKMKLYGMLDQLALKRCFRIIAVSRDLEGRLLRKGIPAKILVRVPNVVDFRNYDSGNSSNLRADLGIDDGTMVLGFVGRLSAEKGLSTLIEASHALKAQGLRFRLLVAGDGPDRERLISLVGDRKMNGVVHFLGQVDNVASVYRTLDVFVLPSYSEGTPMVLLEAIMFGIPIVASEVGGVPDILKEYRRSIMVPPGDTDRLKRAIEGFFQNQDSERCEIQENTDLSDWIKRLESLYAEAAGNQDG